ncbi:DUF6397 family protein [Streptomyces barkulensis]|uniref:DUF6397 family protein n=1 Tax=Streptomyces barkulensis TaxID=1257026 RepID=UPI001180C793|nr:DUF6397 family protein [Streptomyces barkulensis]
MPVGLVRAEKTVTRETDAVEAVPMGEAHRMLGIRPRELELAVELGALATVASRRESRRRRVPVAELARVRAEEGFPATLRERLRLVGAREGAGLLGVTAVRFTRLARAGCFGPVRFSLNRYRAVVWLYLASELRDVAEYRPALLRGPLPEGLLRVLAEGEDWRPRHWRDRRIAQAVRRTDDPWAAAAAHAAVLTPEVLEEAVPDPAERARLAELRPELTTARPESLAARRVVRGLLTADGEDEVLRHRLGLTLALSTARSARPLCRPEREHRPAGNAEAGGAGGAGRGGPVPLPRGDFLPRHGTRQSPPPAADPSPREPAAAVRAVPRR